MTARHLFWALFAGVLSITGMEILVRMTLGETLMLAESPPPPASDWGATLKGNPYLLWEYAPGLREEGGHSVAINSLGMRGPELAVPKPADTRRVLSTGDSSVYGFGVADRAVFLQVAADLLQEGGGPVEAVHAAIPGYSTYQSRNLLEMRGLALEPDVVVLGNQWSDNNFDTFVDRELLDAYSRFEAGWAGRVHRFLSPLATYRILDFSLRIRRGPHAEARKVGWTVGNEGGPGGTRRVEINDFAANLEALVDLAHSAGAEVVILVLAHPSDLAPEPGATPAWDIYRQALRDTATRHGLPVLDGPALFVESEQPVEALFSDALHPSDLGHRLLGEALAELLGGWKSGQLVETGGTGEAQPTYVDPFASNPG